MTARERFQRRADARTQDRMRGRAYCGICGWAVRRDGEHQDDMLDTDHLPLTVDAKWADMQELRRGFVRRQIQRKGLV